MLKIIKNDAMDLPIPKFSCDGSVVGEHLNEYEMLKHFNQFNTTCFLGRPRSGKTSLLISMLTGKGKNKVFNKCFNHVIVVMPTSSRESLVKNPFKNHPSSKMFDELNLKTMQSIYEMVHENAENKETTLIIYDDIGSSLKQKEIQMYLKKLTYNMRHMKVCQFFLLQSYIACPKDIRKLFTNLVIFKPSKIEIENIITETMEQPKEVALDILQLFTEPHQYIMLNIPNQKMYLGFDEIQILDKE